MVQSRETQEAFYRLVPHLVDIDVDDDGTIKYAGTRFVFFRTAIFADLIEAMRDVAGPVIERKIQDFGVQAGKDIAARMDREFKDTSPIEIIKLLFETGFNLSDILDIKPTDSEAQINKIYGYGRYVGWVGGVDTIEYSPGERYEIKWDNSFESYSHGETGQPECRFITGVLKGLCATYWELEPEKLSVTEEACISEGADQCHVIVEAGE